MKRWLSGLRTLEVPVEDREQIPAPTLGRPVTPSPGNPCPLLASPDTCTYRPLFTITHTIKISIKKHNWKNFKVSLLMTLQANIYPSWVFVTYACDPRQQKMKNPSRRWLMRFFSPTFYILGIPVDFWTVPEAFNIWNILIWDYFFSVWIHNLGI